MKIQFVFLIVCVVASFALPEGDRSANGELSGQNEERQRHEGISQGVITVDDELADSQEETVDEQTVASNDTSVAGGRKCNNWKWRRHDRRYWLRRDKEMRRANGNDESNDGERGRPVTSGCLETQTPPQNEISDRHNHRHHHHKHQPNTGTPLIEPSQEIGVPTAI